MSLLSPERFREQTTQRVAEGTPARIFTNAARDVLGLVEGDAFIAKLKRTYADNSPRDGPAPDLPVIVEKPQSKATPAKAPKLKPKGYGPGTELVKLIKEVDLAMGPNCQCEARRQQMDHWGVEACREYRHTIINWLKEGAETVGWFTKLGVAVKLYQQPWFQVLDPFGSITDEAIRRAVAVTPPAG